MVLALDDVSFDRAMGYQVPSGEVGLEFRNLDGEIVVLRAADATADVCLGVRLENEDTARLQGALHVGVNEVTQRRRHVAKDRDDRIPRCITHVKGFEVADACVERRAALFGEFLRLGDTDGAEVDRRDTVTLLGEPHPVAPVTVADDERSAGTETCG